MQSNHEHAVPTRASSDHARTPESVIAANNHRSAAHPELKQCDTLHPEVLQDRSSVIDVRQSKLAEELSVGERNNEQSPLVTINVSGNRFQTRLATLEAYPTTLLGDQSKRQRYWNAPTKEYFFDRHRACFEAILYYYQSNGRLRRPESVPIDTFLEEVSFFELGEEVFAQVHEAENIKIVEQVQLPRMLWRRYIWFYLEFPLYSAVARWISVISMLFTVLSCISLAVETLPVYDHRWDYACKNRSNLSLNGTSRTSCSAVFHSPFFIIQTVCVGYFTIEFLLRLISTPSYIRFVLTFYNWIDLAAIVPYFILLAVQFAWYESTLSTSVIQGLRLLRVLRFLRIFKIYLVLRRLKALRVLSSTIKESLVDFSLMILILTLISFLFGAAAYFAEQEVNGDVFDSMPKAVYWGVITITGVGYGEMYPVTVTGRIVACLCALVGAGMMGMLVSILVDRYQRVYKRKMYVPDSRVPPAELDRLLNGNQTSETSVSASTSNRRRKLLSLVRKMKLNQRRVSSQSNKIQLVVSFDAEHLDSEETNNIVTVVKERVSEVLADWGSGISLKVIEKNDGPSEAADDGLNSSA